MSRQQPSHGPQDLLVLTALISWPTLTWVHDDPRAMVLNVNAACFHGAGESVLNATLTVSNYATTHGAGVKSLQTAGNVFNKGENTFMNRFKSSGFHLRWTKRSVGSSSWTIKPLAVPHGVPITLQIPAPEGSRWPRSGPQPMPGLSKPHTVTKTSSPLQSMILGKIAAV